IMLSYKHHYLKTLHYGYYQLHDCRRPQDISPGIKAGAGRRPQAEMHRRSCRRASTAGPDKETTTTCDTAGPAHAGHGWNRGPGTHQAALPSGPYTHTDHA